jgi:biopolymer transport protein ExbD
VPKDPSLVGRGSQDVTAEPPLQPPPRRRRRGNHEEEGEEQGELNLTAMIDMMTILLVFLLKSYSVSTTNISATDLKLPRSTTPESIVESTKVTLTKKSVLVNEKPVVPLTQSDIGPVFAPELSGDPKRPCDVSALHTKLEEAAEKQKKILEKRGDKLNSKLLLIADQNTPFETIAKVLYTAGQVEITRSDGSKDGWFNEYKFVVIVDREK